MQLIKSFNYKNQYLEIEIEYERESGIIGEEIITIIDGANVIDVTKLFRVAMPNEIDNLIDKTDWAELAYESNL